MYVCTYESTVSTHQKPVEHLVDAGSGLMNDGDDAAAAVCHGLHGLHDRLGLESCPSHHITYIHTYIKTIRESNQEIF